jgi:hypothetical protein
MRRIAIIIVLAALVVIAAAGYYSWHRSSTGAGPDSGAEPSLVSLLPPGAPYVFYVDVAALRKAEFLAKLSAIFPAPAEDPEYTEFVRATGFDYSRDLDRVAITSIPGASSAGSISGSSSGVSATAFMTLAEGRFDQQKIQAYALRSGKTEQRDGQTFYVIDSGASVNTTGKTTSGNATGNASGNSSGKAPGKQSGNSSGNPSGNIVTLRFLSATRIELITRPKQSAPSENSAQRNSGRSDSPQNSSPAPSAADVSAFRDHVARVSGAMVFGVLRMDSVPRDLSLGPVRMDAIADTIKNVHWLSLAVTAEGENLRVSIEGECGSMLESAQLQVGLGALRMLGRGALSDPSVRRQITPEGLAALDKLAAQIDISHDGARVRIMAVLSPDMLTSFAAPPPNSHPNSTPTPAPAPNKAPTPKRTPAGR